MVWDIDGQPLDDVIVAAANQDHGIIAVRNGRDSMTILPVGTELRILSNHACVTAAHHSGYHVTDGNAALAYWPRLNGR